MRVYFLFKVLKIVLNLKLRKPAEAVNDLLMAGRAINGKDLQRQRNGVILPQRAQREYSTKDRKDFVYFVKILLCASWLNYFLK
jgi:hypothetical protein